MPLWPLALSVGLSSIGDVSSGLLGLYKHIISIGSFSSNVWVVEKHVGGHVQHSGVLPLQLPSYPTSEGPSVPVVFLLLHSSVSPYPLPTL